MTSKLTLKFDSTICRVCLQEEGQISLFEPNKNVENFHFITLLEAYEGDGLPQSLCIKCHVRLKVAYQFKTQAISSNTQLKSYLNEINKNFSELSQNKNPFEDIEDEIEYFNDDLPETDKILIANSNFMETENIFADSVDYVRYDIKEEKSSNSKVEFQIVFQPEKETEVQKKKKKCSKELNEKIPDRLNEKIPDRLRRVNDILQCSICENTFTTELNLNRHMEMHLDNRESYSCQICGKLFTQRASVRQHLLIHSGERPFSCDKCPKTFRRRKTLLGHQKSHIKQTDFKCKYCGKSFQINRRLLLHINREHKTIDESSIPLYSCENCGKMYRSKYSLNDHILSHHASQLNKSKAEVKCSECNKSFISKYKLSAHMKMHLPKSENDMPVHKCTECPEVFKSKRSLKMHFEVHETNEKYHCSICGSTFGRKYNLLLHMQEHEQKATDFYYSCRKCEKQFFSLDNLNEHLRGHISKSSGMFKCLYCEDFLLTKSGLKSHIVSNHKDEFKEWNLCSLCDLPFNTFDEFYDHMIQNHIPFDGNCKECGASFEDEDALNEHSIEHDALVINE